MFEAACFICLYRASYCIHTAVTVHRLDETPHLVFRLWLWTGNVYAVHGSIVPVHAVPSLVDGTKSSICQKIYENGQHQQLLSLCHEQRVPVYDCCNSKQQCQETGQLARHIHECASGSTLIDRCLDGM